MDFDGWFQTLAKDKYWQIQTMNTWKNQKDQFN